MLDVVTRNPRRANRLALGDKHDTSVEHLISKSSADMVIVERDGKGFKVCDANYMVAPVLPATAIDKAETPSVEEPPKTKKLLKEVSDAGRKEKDKVRRSRRK